MMSKDVKNNFGAALDRVLAGEPIIVTKYNKPIAILISLADYYGDVSRYYWR